MILDIKSHANRRRRIFDKKVTLGTLRVHRGVLFASLQAKSDKVDNHAKSIKGRESDRKPD